ncbi:hypothetical protein ScalyP_jg10900, partial [Parmales sp. scaly parma]
MGPSRPAAQRPPLRPNASSSRTRRNNSDSSDNITSTSFSRGDKVEARYKGKSKYYPGKIVRDNRDGTYDVDYDDGEKEKDVKGNLIQSLEKKKKSNNSDSEADGDILQRGDKVEARYKGKSKYYKGKIARDNRDGTYDVDYDDGEKEKDVKKSLINKISGGGGMKRSPRKDNDKDKDSETEAEAESFSRGDKVEARYKGKSKYYEGKIARDNRDGTYDIDYNDGEKEKDVKANLIKSKPSSQSLSRGDKVEARYRGGQKYYKGVVAKENRDGTFDVNYDDGEKEAGVEKRLIQKISGGGGMKHSPRGKSRDKDNDSETENEKFSSGDKIEARYKGKSKYYAGKIARDNRDGTYDVDYDDGEKEKDVKGNLIKSLEKKKKSNNSDSEAEGDTLQRGDKVEARYKGKSKYYKGKIARDNRDGT